MGSPPRWPGGARAAAAFTFDLDAETLWLGWGKTEPVTVSQGTYGARVGTPLVLDLLRETGVTATFFVPGWVAEHHAETVRAILAAGHEVACHGYLHETVKDLGQADEEAILQKALAALALLMGTPPVGYRAPAWELSPQTLGLLAKHGFRYSSNLMDAVAPYLHPGDQLVELPVHWILDDAPYFLFPVVKPLVAPGQALEAWRAEFDGISALGGLTVFTFHPQLVGRPSRLAALRELIRHVQSIPAVWVAPLAAIAEHWAEHAR